MNGIIPNTEHFGVICNYCREPRGFGFVKFRNAEDAAEAKHHLNHSVIGGREIAIVFAEENRKTPQEMRTNSRVRYSYFSSPFHFAVIVCLIVAFTFSY